jgi:hypothetical protein
MSSEFSVGGPARRVFARIAALWSLSEDEQNAILCQPVEEAFQFDDGSGDVQIEMLERVSYLIGIYRALHAIFPNDDQADRWIRRANMAPPFGGLPALALMCTGRVSDLASVRQYLDAQGPFDP